MSKKVKTLHIVIIILLTFCSALFLIMSIKLDAQFSYISSSTANKSNVITLNSGWSYHWGDSPIDNSGSYEWLDNSVNDSWVDFQFPGRPKNSSKYDTIWIREKLPQEKIDNAYFSFRAPQQYCQVYIDGKLIYNYGSYDPAQKVRTPGSAWHFVRLPENYNGKVITLKLQSPFPHYIGYLSVISLGEKADLYLEVFKSNILDIIAGSIFTITGLVLLLMVLVGAANWYNVIYLGFTSFFIGCWYISDSRILVLLFNTAITSTYAANFFIFLTPVFLLIYIERTFTVKHVLQRVLLRIQWTLHLLLAFTAFLLDLFGIVSCLYFDTYFHLLLAISLLLVAYTGIKAIRSNVKKAILFVSGLLALGITGILDTYMMFYNTSPGLVTVRISFVGMLYFLLTLLIKMGLELKVIYKQLENYSKELETNYKSLFTNMADGSTYNHLEFDNDGTIKKCTIIEANDVFLKNLNFQKDRVLGSDMFCLFPELQSTDLHFKSATDESAAASEAYTRNNPVKLGSKWYKLSAFSPKKDYLFILFSDITYMKIAEETIRHQAYTDVMTNFYNRTYFEDYMLKLYQKADALSPTSIIVIDIDGLKIINDTFGHNSGDLLIKEAAKIISSIFSSTGFTSRIGGDEFCIILPYTDYDTASEMGRRLEKAVETVNDKNPVIPISISIGIATNNEGSDEDLYSVYRRADDDMYRYKMSQSSSEKSKVIDMLLTALNERDYVMQGHVARLTGLCHKISETLLLQDNQKRNLILLSKVHDLGKIGIPDIILKKPGGLTSIEYDKIKQHVKIGFNIASRSKELVLIAPLILHHHEHYDGSGYPDGLRGEDIPLECRILSIIDSFDAMTNDRPYHKSISIGQALTELRKCSGKQFDPDLVKNFIKIVLEQHPEVSV